MSDRTVDDLLQRLAASAEDGYLIYVGVDKDKVSLEFVLGPYDGIFEAPTLLEALTEAVAGGNQP